MDAARDFGSTSQQRAADYAILGNGRSAKLGWAMQDYNPRAPPAMPRPRRRTRAARWSTPAPAQLALLLAEVSRLPLSTANTQPLP